MQYLLLPVHQQELSALLARATEPEYGPAMTVVTAEGLRALAYEDLDAAVLLGCEMSIQEMAERGLPVHPNTVKARDWLRSKTKGTSD